MNNPRPAPAEAPQSTNNTHLTLKAHVFTLMAFGQLGTAHRTEPNMGPVLMEIINQSPQFAKQSIYTAGEWPESDSYGCHRRAHRLTHIRCQTHVLTCTYSPTPGSPQYTGASLVTCAHSSGHTQTPDSEITRRAVLLIQTLPACKVIQAMQSRNFTASGGWSKAPQLITGSYSCSEHKVVPAPGHTHTAPLHT